MDVAQRARCSTLWGGCASTTTIGVLGIALATLFIPELKEETPRLDAKGSAAGVGFRWTDIGRA